MSEAADTQPDAKPGADAEARGAAKPATRVNTRLLAVAAPPLVVAALVIVNGWAGLMPGVGFWDTGEFQTVLPVLGTAHPTGYPTYVLLGFLGNILLTPIGEPAFRVTALSLVAVAVAAGATVLLVRRLTGSTVMGIAAGLGLATTQLVWSNATRADPHAFHLAFVALLLLALVRWEQGRREVDARRADRRLLLAAVLFGLAAGNHSLTLLVAPPIAVYVLSVEPGIWRRWRFVLACLGAAFGTMALVYLELPIRGGLIRAPLVYGEPATWDGFWYIALAEQFRGSLGNVFSNLPDKVDYWVTFATAQVGALALAIPPALIVAARRAPKYTLLTGLTVVITVLFNAAYANAEIERYYLGPVLIVWTWLAIFAAEVAVVAGFLLAELVDRVRRARLSAPGAQRATTLVAIALGIAMLLPTLLDLDARRRLADRSDQNGAAQWLAEVLPVIPERAILVSWWSTSTPLWYAQHVMGLRPDIFVADDRTMLDLHLGRAPDVIEANLGVRPVYVIRLAGPDTDELLRRFDMTKVASEGHTAVWQVNGRLAAAQ